MKRKLPQAEARTIDFFTKKTLDEEKAEAEADDLANQVKQHVEGVDTESHLLRWFVSSVHNKKFIKDRVRLVVRDTNYILQFISVRDGAGPLTGKNVIACREFSMSKLQYLEMIECVREERK